MRKIKIGHWYYVYFPLKEDINKRTKKGQEIRICYVDSFINDINKYKVQMLTKEDKKN